MIKAKHWRAIAVAISIAFVSATVAILLTDPERRLFVLWLLCLAGSIHLWSRIAHAHTRADKRRREQHDTHTLVSGVERGCRLYSVDSTD